LASAQHLDRGHLRLEAVVGFLHQCEPELWKHLLDEKRACIAESMIRAGIDTPRTSSVGRHVRKPAAAPVGGSRSETRRARSVVESGGAAGSRRDLAGQAALAAARVTSA
jgi:hypothetical protein